MNQLSSEQISKELAECHKAVKDLTGIDMDLFRPPFGEYNNTVVETSFANSYYPIQWDIDILEIKRKVSIDVLECRHSLLFFPLQQKFFH